MGNVASKIKKNEKERSVAHCTHEGVEKVMQNLYIFFSLMIYMNSVHTLLKIHLFPSSHSRLGPANFIVSCIFLTNTCYEFCFSPRPLCHS
jgi:hypothetical protein